MEKLHAKIGQLVVERDFFSEGFRSQSVDRRADDDSDHPSLGF
jgi:hypothetical protein